MKKFIEKDEKLSLTMSKKGQEKFTLLNCVVVSDEDGMFFNVVEIFLSFWENVVVGWKKEGKNETFFMVLRKVSLMVILSL